MGLVGPGRMDSSMGHCSLSSLDFSRSSPGLREPLWLRLLLLFNIC